jgi:hypothetical protein
VRWKGLRCCGCLFGECRRRLARSWESLLVLLGNGGGWVTAYAKEKLLRSTLTTKTTASGKICLAICLSNSKRPPPAIPPVPFEIQRPNWSIEGFPGLLDPLYAPPAGAVGYAGATAAPNPILRRGPPRARVRLEKPTRRMWVSMSWTYVPARGYGNLQCISPNSSFHSN